MQDVNGITSLRIRESYFSNNTILLVIIINTV